ncbi:MAG: extracellular solute-binding protein [Chloroflexi bacterium]|nr:extracellular solute-binding protein [Chloroflexota bacterium]
MKSLISALLVCFLVVGGVSAREEDIVHLMLWHSQQGAQANALQALINAFQNVYPTITITPIFYASGTLPAAFASVEPEQRPDMLLAANDSVGFWVNAGLVKDLSVTISGSLKSQASITAWSLFQFKEDFYAIPYSAQTLAFFYNKALVPTIPTTWGDVLAAAQQVHADHTNITGLAFQNGFFQSAGFLFAQGGQLLDLDGNAAFADGSDGAAALDKYLLFQKDMSALGRDVSSGVIVDASSPNPGFEAGTVAMIYDGLWNLTQYEQDLGDNLGVSTMPVLDNGKVPAMFVQGQGFYLAASADDVTTRAFIDWGKFVTSVAGQTIVLRQGGLLPVNPTVQPDSPNLRAFADQIALGTPFPNRQEISEFWGPLSDAITAVVTGDKSPDQARHDAYIAIQTALDALHEATPAATISP